MTRQPPPGPVPDRLERVIRFVCGAVVGAILGILSGLAWLMQAESPLVAVALALGTPILFGKLAMRLGDRFWLGLRKWIWWFS